MSSQRISRVNELMRRELGAVVLRLATDVDVSTLTITRVDTAPNLRHADVYVSVRGDDEAWAAAMRSLRRLRNEMQRHIAVHMTLKYTPKLRLVEDHSLAIGGHVLEVLDELKLESLQHGPDFPDDPGHPDAPGEAPLALDDEEELA